MQISTISIKRQITLSKAEMEKLGLAPYDRVVKSISEDGMHLRPLKRSIVESTAGVLTQHIYGSKRNVDLSKIMKETKKRAAKKLRR